MARHERSTARRRTAAPHARPGPPWRTWVTTTAGVSVLPGSSQLTSTLAPQYGSTSALCKPITAHSRGARVAANTRGTARAPSHCRPASHQLLGGGEKVTPR